MKNRKIIYIILFIVILILTGIIIKCQQSQFMIIEWNKDAFGNKNFYKCEKNSDCIPVTFGCGCASYGANIAINKNYSETWHKSFNKLSGCNFAISNHPSCYSEAKCINRSCEMVLSKKSICSSYELDNCKNYPERFMKGASDLHILQDFKSKWSGISCQDIIKMCK